ncbi:hypothetical protein J4G08_19510 [Candidatus Poribacteria bacterium]|nr:hypothetical protein [Candidatus Poribacteria bacterium]
MPQKTAFVYHPDYLNHDTGPEHPERPSNKAMCGSNCTILTRYPRPLSRSFMCIILA